MNVVPSRFRGTIVTRYVHSVSICDRHTIWQRTFDKLLAILFVVLIEKKDLSGGR